MSGQEPHMAPPSASQEHRQRLPPTPMMNLEARGAYGHHLGATGDGRNPLGLVSGNTQRMGGGGAVGGGGGTHYAAKVRGVR